MVVGSLRLLGSESAWLNWLWLAVGFGVLLLPIFIRLAWTPIGYLKSMELRDEYLLGKNFFGKEFRIPYARIGACRKSATTPEHGRGNPVVVVRTRQFPFHLEMNCKGYADRKVELLAMAINHRMGKRARKKVGSV